MKTARLITGVFSRLYQDPKKYPVMFEIELLQGTTLLYVGAIYIIWFGLSHSGYRFAVLHLY